MSALRFSVNRIHFAHGAFPKQWRHGNHVISLTEFYSTSNRNVWFRKDPGFLKEGEGVKVADTTKGIHDRVSIDILDHPRSTLDRDSVNTQSTLHQPRGRQSVECPPHMSEILWVSARPATCYRQSTSGPNGGRYADRVSIEGQSRVSIDTRSRKPLVHMIQKNYQRTKFLSSDYLPLTWCTSFHHL